MIYKGIEISTFLKARYSKFLFILRNKKWKLWETFEKIYKNTTLNEYIH